MDANYAIQIVRDSLDTVSQVFELGSDFSAVSEIIHISGRLSSALTVVGAILSLVGNFLPDGKHEEILTHFRGFSTKIDRVRDDIKNLHDEIGWELTENHYTDAVNHIELGMKYWVDIGRATEKKGRDLAKNRLKNLCDHEACTLHLNNLLKGMTGNGFLTSSSILDKFDVSTAKGHRNRISSLATRLLKVVSGGIMVIVTYEAMMHGEEEAKQFIDQNGYASQLEEASRKAQSVLDRCVTNFRQNMLNDLDMFLDTGRPNRDLVSEIRNFMRDKYDWLENFVLVYNDLHGFDQHCFTGHRVHSLHRNGKCGIVFYRNKGEVPKYSDDDEAEVKTFNSAIYFHAQRSHDDIVHKLMEKHIEWTGIAVLKRDIDLWFTATFSTKTVSDVGYYATTIILLK